VSRLHLVYFTLGGSKKNKPHTIGMKVIPGFFLPVFLVTQNLIEFLQ